MTTLRPDADLLFVTRAPALRRCWHPVAFLSDLASAPVARRVLGTDIVLWRDAGDALAAAVDRCPHRWAKLSVGDVVDGDLRCGYHGWRFAAHGGVTEIPHLDPGAPRPPAACLETLAVAERIGMAWVNLRPDHADPAGLPWVPEHDDDRFHAIRVGTITYRTSAAAIIDNNTDGTHIAFVHAGSFGADQDPRVPVGQAERTAFGVRITTDAMPVARTPTAERPGTRVATTDMWLPFTQVSRLEYSDGSTHILVKGCCPVDDDRTDVHLTVLRNVADDPAAIEAVVRFELAVEHEDRALLDTVPAGFPLDPSLQAHTKHDRPGIAYRRALAELVGSVTG